MATLSNALSYSRTQAQTDSNGLTDAKGIQFANEALLDFIRRLVMRGVDAAQLQESYTDGTANQGTYLYPTDMFFLKAIEVNFADTSDSNYLKAEQLDVSNLQETAFSWLRANQSEEHPMFDDRGDWFEIFPTPTTAHNLTSLFRIFYFKEPTEYTATSDTINYPMSLDYRILSWRIASDYLYSLGDIEKGQAFNEKYEERVEQLIKTLSRGSQQPTQATPIIATGWNF